MLAYAFLLIALALTSTWSASAGSEVVRSMDVGGVTSALMSLVRRTTSLPQTKAPPTTSDTFCPGASRDALELDTEELAANTVGERNQLLLWADQYVAAGQYREAFVILSRVVAYSQVAADKSRLARAKASLGNLYFLTDQWRNPEAEASLRDAIFLAEQNKLPDIAAAARHDLGNILSKQGRYPEALNLYEEARDGARALDDVFLSIRTLTNAARVERLRGRRARAHTLLLVARKELDALPSSSEKALVLVNMADVLEPQTESHVDGLLGEAIAIAEITGEARTISHSTGALSAVYEARRRYSEALELVAKAIHQAQLARAPDLLYRWYWRAGRLYRALGDVDAAIDAYRQAAFNVEQVRSALLCRYSGETSALRKVVVPIYRDLSDLLLQGAPDASDKVRELYLAEAQRAVEQLKVAELQDHFLDECVTATEAKATPLDQLDSIAPHTAVLYPIQLPDRIELLLITRKGIQQFKPVWQKAVAVTAEVERLRSKVNLPMEQQKLISERGTAYLPHAQQLYDWLIRPIKPTLAAEGVQTLVVVSYGDLLTVPFALLHDGVRYLLDSYAVAISPGLVLTEATPTDVRDARALVMGIAEARHKQPALIHVRKEIEGVKAVFGKERVTVLPDAEFSVANVKKVMRDRPYNIVHFATHAKFAGGISRSWIQAYDRNIYWPDLEELMGYHRFTEQPVELLVLSACETAEGSLDAVLGLSGIALRAGARSAVGTLWEPFDFAAAKLIPAFYREWAKSNTSKAEALRRAQRTLIKDKDKEYDLSHPTFWSPFVIIGNWL